MAYRAQAPLPGVPGRGSSYPRVTKRTQTGIGTSTSFPGGRTAGEMRVSNFLLWQAAYAELWVTDTLWPDFGERELGQALRDFAERERKFGKVGGKQAGDAAHRVGRALRTG